jgi:hypothetical protein
VIAGVVRMAGVHVVSGVRTMTTGRTMTTMRTVATMPAVRRVTMPRGSDVRQSAHGHDGEPGRSCREGDEVEVHV